MLTSRLNLPIPGGWSRDTPAQETGQDAPPESLAAGVVGETGKVLDDSGKPVAKITEGEPKDLIGNVVTATGDIVSSTGDIVGKAVPLSQKEAETVPTQPEQKKEGFSFSNTAKTAKSAADTVGDTVQTVSKLQPVTGKVTKGLGLGETNSVGGRNSVKEEKPLEEEEQEEKEQEEKEQEEKEQEEKEQEEKEQETPKQKDDTTSAKDAEQDDAKETSMVDRQTEDLEEQGEPIHLEDKSVPKDTHQVPPDTQRCPKVEGEKPLDTKTDTDAPADLPVRDECCRQTSKSEGKKPTEESPADVPADETKVDVSGDVESKTPGEDDLATISNPDESGVKEGEEAPKSEKAPEVEEAPKSEETPKGEETPMVEESPTVEEAPEVEQTPKGEEAPKGEETPKDEEAPVVEGTSEAEEAPKDEEAPKVEDVPRDEEGPKDEEVPATEDKSVAPEGSLAGSKTELAEDQEAAPPAEGDIAEQPAEDEPAVDYSILKDAKVNKAGNLVNDKGQVIGRVNQGILKHLIGRRADENGEIWNDAGKVIGKAEPIPETEREEFKEPAPFEDFPGATVESDGKVMFNGEAIGIVVDGDPKKLKGKKVDDDGDILDRAGNVIGKAERWEEEVAPPEPEVVIDRSILAGKRVNKLGNVVDSSGTIYGRLIEGDPKRLAGRMCDKEGNVRSESGDILGKAELVPEGEREGLKEGPFAELPGCTVNKEGKVVTPGGDVVGRLVSGDPKVLFGRAVDEDGDILDKNGNSLGKAERWEEPVVEKEKNPMCGRKVNREGNVVDTEGNIIGKLTSGELSICAGKEVDNDGDVVDSKGNTVGHVSLLADIPPTPEPEVTETPEEKEKREQAEQDKKLAKQMAACLEQCLDKIRPICKMITQKIEKADRTPKDELDEEALVKEVRPLIEEGHKILQEANGIIRGLDPDGHIQANAKHKTASREATPEEYHLADVLKELTGTVTECIDNAKKKIEDMPHAKKELNPLWGLLTEPLFQILAAVGLLLNGVLELVGRLLSGLGLGGLVNNLLGSLGLTKLLKSLGVGSVVTALTGQKDKKK